MQRTKLKNIVFGVIMSYAMATGMEIYNNAIKLGTNLSPGGLSNMRYDVFLGAFKEIWYMGIIVFVISNLWGNRIGAKLAEKHFDFGKDNTYLCRLMRQACTVAIMCPSMSLAASILFNIILGGNSIANLPAIFIGTLFKNLPMAFFWNMFAAAPFTHWLFSLIFREKE